MTKIKQYLLSIIFFVSPLIFLPNVMRNAFYIKTIFIYLGLSLFLAILLVEIISKKNIKIPKLNSIDVAVLLFWCVAVLSWVISLIRFPDYRTAIFSAGSSAILFLTFNAVIIYFIGRFAFKDEKILNRIISILLAAACIASIYGILQFFGVELVWPQGMNPYANRPVSTFGNPTFLASFLIMLIPLSIYRVLFYKEKIIWVIATVIMLTALICTATRSAWLGLGLGLIFFLFYYLKIQRGDTKKVIKIMTTILILGIGIIVLSPARNMVKQRVVDGFSFKSENQAVHQRLFVWKIAKDMFLDQPLIGYGWGNFELFSSLKQGSYLSNEQYKDYSAHANNVHNEILEQLSQVGIIGFGIFIFLLLSLVRFIKKGYTSKNINNKQKMELIAICTSITVMLIDNMFNVTLHFPVPMIVFWFLIALGVTKTSLILKDVSVKEYVLKFPIKILFSFVVMFVVMINIFQIRYFVSEKLYFYGLAVLKGPNTYNNNTRAIKWFEKVKKYNPNHIKNLFSLGNTYARLNRWDEAEKTFKQAINAHPGYYEVYINLGRVYLNKGDMQNAKKHFDKARELNPVQTTDVPKL